MRGKAWLCLLLMTVLLTGCTKEKQPDAEKTGYSDRMQIGFTLDSRVLERWIRDVDVFVSTAERMGAQVDIQNANGDLNEQISQIEYFIESGKDVIVVVPVDCYGLTEVLTEAREAGVKIVSYDRLIDGVQSDLYISFDNYRIGVLMGETMLANLPEGGKVLMICGPETDSNVTQVQQGFQDTLSGSALEIIGVEHAEGWAAEYAFRAVNSAFEEITDIDGVMCGNDGLAVQAIRALSERRLAGQVCVVGQDADVEACQKIVEGLQTMTVYKDIEELARTAAEYAVMLAQDLPLDENFETVKSGDYEIPQLLIEPVAVTSENMDEVIIENGFHMRDDIYLNVY